MKFESEEKFRLNTFRKEVFDRIMNVLFKRQDNEFLKEGANLFEKELKKLSVWNENEILAQYFENIETSAGKIEGGEIDNEHFGNLLYALKIQDVYTDDVMKNFEIVTDLTQAISKINVGSKPVKKLKVAKKGNRIS